MSRAHCRPDSADTQRYDLIISQFSTMNMTHLLPVLIALKRHPGYEDVHPDLVMEDAMQPGWPWSFVRDDGSAVVVAVERPEGYERCGATTLAKDVVKPTWPSWSVVKQE